MKHMVTCIGHKLIEKGFNFGEVYEVIYEGNDENFTVESERGDYILSKKLFKDVGTQENMLLVQVEINDIFDEANETIQGLLGDLTELKNIDEEEKEKENENG